MRVRVTPDSVPALTQITDLVGVQEGGASDATGDDEKMTPPPSAHQLIPGVYGALAPVIEGEDNVAAGLRDVHVRDQRDARPTGDRIEMRGEIGRASCRERV